MDRMSPQDAMFISVEDEKNPMHIGNVSVFEGPAPSYGDLVRTVASHLGSLPRYRQRVRLVPMGLGRPVWVDDPHFQILYHVRHTATPPPGSPDELRNLAGRVFAASGSSGSVGVVVGGLQRLVDLLGERMRGELVQVAAGGAGEEL